MKRLAVAIAALVLVAPVLAAPPSVTGRAWLVENGATGQVLLAHAARQRVPIASITKLMTVLLTLEHTRLNDVVTVSPAAAEVGESSANLRPGERLTVRELLEAALIQSANDAADALADHVGNGDRARFVAMMNAKARRLGLRDTHYVRPDGLDAPGHFSSAHDVTLLARILMHYPAVRQIVRMRAATIDGDDTLHTWNDLLYSYPGIYGVKTGHTSEAGWSEIAAARRNGVSIYATLIGSPDRGRRNADLTRLLDWGFSRYVRAQPVVKGRAYAEAELGYGRAPLKLVAAASLAAAFRAGRPVVRRVVFSDVAPLPVSRGQSLGQVRIYQGGRLVGAVPLVAERAVGRPGLAGRVGWYATRTLHDVAGWFS
ncbi:MAG TPA: D-alanyl-D-alanine carboxypeptidase family protein [Gaiellaceae bacterium]|nr:D-alanyl-D-alanine carboxypeptidase family protein [Gaiellaceae bacterium]